MQKMKKVPAFQRSPRARSFVGAAQEKEAIGDSSDEEAVFAPIPTGSRWYGGVGGQKKLNQEELLLLEKKKAEEKRNAEEEKKRAEEEKKKAEEEKQAAETTEEPDPNQLLVRRVANGVNMTFGVLDDVTAHTLTISLTREGTYKQFSKLQTGEEPLSFSYRGASYAFSAKPAASVKDVRKRAIAVALR